MQITDELVRSVVQEVLSHMRNGKSTPANGQGARWGVFDDVDSAVSAAMDAQQQFEKRGLEDRRKAVNCIRRICIDQA
jgi:aldehyde dehydrogenase